MADLWPTSSAPGKSDLRSQVKVMCDEYNPATALCMFSRLRLAVDCTVFGTFHNCRIYMGREKVKGKNADVCLWTVAKRDALW